MALGAADLEESGPYLGPLPGGEGGVEPTGPARDTSLSRLRRGLG